MRWPSRLVFVGLLVLPVMAIMMPLCRFTSGAKVTSDVKEHGRSALLVMGKLCGPSACEPALLFHGGVDEASMGRLREAAAKLPEGAWVCLESNGGESDAARETAGFFRERKLNTCVAPRREESTLVAVDCGSACSTLWLGGTRRVLAAQKASVGFHQAFIGDGWCCALSNAVKAGQARWAMGRDSDSLGDAQAREVLYRKGSSCGPREFYRLRALEAAQLRLVPMEAVEAQWTWERVGAGPELATLPHAGECQAPA